MQNLPKVKHSHASYYNRFGYGLIIPLMDKVIVLKMGIIVVISVKFNVKNCQFAKLCYI